MLGENCATFQRVMRAIAGFVSKLQPQVTVGLILHPWAVWVVWRQAGSGMCAQGSAGLVLCFQQERWEHALVLNVSSTFSLPQCIFLSDVLSCQGERGKWRAGG